MAAIKIQFASDLYIDITSSKKKFIEPKGDILCLLGNICSCGTEHGISILRTFLMEECSTFKKVLFIAGNYEFYSTGYETIDEIKIKLRELEVEIKNFIFLDDEIVGFCYGSKQLIFVGTTLWSYIPDHCKKVIKNMDNDFKSINLASYIFTDKEVKKFVRRLNVEDTQKLHLNAKKFIIDAIKYLKTKKNITAILLTHHKPVWDTYNHYNPYTSYTFQSNLHELIMNPINIVIHGKVWHSRNKIINNVKILSNPHGYEKEYVNYDNAAYIELLEDKLGII